MNKYNQVACRNIALKSAIEKYNYKVTRGEINIRRTKSDVGNTTMKSDIEVSQTLSL